jgi:hypothetical protein
VLKRWTGKDLSESAEYERLWKEHEKELVDPARKKRADPLAGIEWEYRGTSVASRLPKFFGQEIRSQDVVFVVDTSISMMVEDPLPPAGVGPGTGGEGSGGEPRGPRQRLLRMQHELVRMLTEMSPEIRFGIVAFDEQVVHFAKSLQPASTANKRRAIDFARGLVASGETWTDRALEAAFELSGARTIVLLSDGMPFRSSDPIDVLGLIRWVEQRNRFEHIEIHTIGFGGSSREVSDFLKELARRNRGKYTEIR